MRPNTNRTNRADNRVLRKFCARNALRETRFGCEDD